MDKFEHIIAAIKNLEHIKPPDALVEQVMTKVNKVPQRSTNPIQRLLLMRQTGTAGSFTGRITSYQQCVFILFIVGFFYLMAGSVALWGLHDAIARENIHLWVKIQPYITIGSAFFIICAALLILYHPEKTSFIQYAMTVHTSLIMVNAFILESILSFPMAIYFVMILTILAVVFGVLLIGSIQAVLNFKIVHEGNNCVKDI